MIILPGTVIMWGLTVGEIPAGWVLCDGSNGSPDLRDRFVFGASGSVPVGSTGGASTVTLVADELPAHTHGVGSIGVGTAGFHDHDYYVLGGLTTIAAGTVVDGPSSTTVSSTTDAAGNHTHTLSGNTGSTGGGAAHNNLPPYKAVLFIMKV